MRSAPALLIPFILLPAFGCTETRIVERRGINIGALSDGSGAQPQNTFEGILGSYAPDDLDESEALDPSGLRREREDGSIVLVSRSPRHLIYHLMQTINAQEWDLLYEHLLAEDLKDAYAQRGLDPEESVAFIRRHRDDVRELLITMPAGEYSPQVRMETIGRNAFRLRMSSAELLEMRFESIDVVIEDGSFRLLLID
ncbi:MAG: hypothetical protein AAGD00_08765 [Planctomycetota bacterium]